jgi:radical SAM protein with 4Fe4S-binding SPASM domain
MANLTTLAPLAWKHTVNAVAEEIYIKTGYDATKPTTFYGEINEHCNVKCRYCPYWRLPEYVPEMTIKEWEHALLSIKDFVGKFSINFSGGEGFIKRGFIDLIAWCSANGISAGCTTNGSRLTRENARKLVAARPLNVNISVDSPNPAMHDYLRGCPGLFKRLSQGIKYLVEERAVQGASFPIVIKPVVTALNFRDIPDLVEWTKAIGASCVHTQPVMRSTQETYDELWIKEADIPELERVVRHLIDMKRAGEPIMTQEHVLALMPDHFRLKKAPRSAMPCRVGLRNCMIHADGDVFLCERGFSVIGNLRRQTMREIWHGPKAREVRKETVACERLCLGTCLSQKSILSKVKMGLIMFKNSRRSPAAPTREAVAAPSEAAPTVTSELVQIGHGPAGTPE